MTPFEYVLTLVSVLVGLAIADLAVSLHRLLRARARIRWDWLPLGAALLAVLAVLDLWWGFYDSRSADWFTTLGGFLPFAGQLVTLFLLNAAALPDRVPDDGLDLASFYDRNGPYFWSLFVVYVVFIMAINVILRGLPGEMDVGDLASSLGPNLLLAGFFLLLARVRHRLLHAVGITGLLVVLIVRWWSVGLG